MARPVLADAPPPLPREHYQPPWYHRRFSDVQHSATSVKTLVQEIQRGALRLPRFQRPWVWTDEQIMRLFDSMISGYHVGSLLCWEQWSPPASVERFGEVEVTSPGKLTAYLVVDGQQRLGSIATAALSGRFWLDLDAGKLVKEPGPWRMPAGLVLDRRQRSDAFHWPEPHAAEHGLPREHVFDAWCSMEDAIDRAYVSAIRLGHDWELPRVMETFKRINTEGTRIDPVELEAALERARGDGP